MLKTITTSTNRKLGACAATYRAGSGERFGTCPDSCPLKPEVASGVSVVDQEYLEAVLDAVPEDGCSWTYTHFQPGDVPLPQLGKTTINLSSDSYAQALEYVSKGYPTVITVPAGLDSKVEMVDGVRFVRCPAEYNDDVSCATCGGDTPLCARPTRDYVVKFTAHGSKAKLVGQEAKGGCYGSGGPVAIHWTKTSRQEQPRSDSQVLRDWVKTLPRGTKVRHHVLGDLGRTIH